mmetsp:Transcript_43916/g.70268  ORF Transcript_43916/g.70268 Transcript_43916/m.70268 type:complete len:247 (+) Transcript_43916:177-917(+)
MEVVSIPILGSSANYAYLLVDRARGECGAVDPADAKEVFEAANKLGVRITHVLTTHDHWDHAQGNLELVRMLGGEGKVEVLGGRNDNIPACTRAVGDGDSFQVGTVEVRVLDTPCHTPGHVCYVTKETDGTPCVFTGDTLFVGGSGNLNSGTAAQMKYALIDVLGALDDETRVYVGHNYTEKNLRFALHVEPENEYVIKKLEEARDKNSRREFICSTIGGEKQYNPFMRCTLPSIQEWAKKTWGLY